MRFLGAASRANGPTRKGECTRMSSFTGERSDEEGRLVASRDEALRVNGPTRREDWRLHGMRLYGRTVRRGGKIGGFTG